ncbi:nicotinamide N-methyltransferase-like [Hyperolius riggenbachi]|uniref:nicotinamide N-methyltransferase-like n=1 Tax=Hyperolius riggenbachi TaxID=752182 RepID=UPI0035A2D627
MDCSETKLYHEHGFCSKSFLETYFSENSTMVFGDETMKFPIEKMNEMCASGDIKGDVLTDISIGPLIHHLYPMCDIFKQLFLLRFSERCILELRKWCIDGTGAFNWSHIQSIAAGLFGDSKQLETKHALLRSAIKQIVKCHSDREYLTHPLQLPQADCVSSCWILEVISTDEARYQSNLKKIGDCVKPGGYLLLVGAVNGTFFTVGNQRMHLFNHNEDFVKDALAKEGFTVIKCEVLQRKAESDLSDYKGMSFIAARKDK